MEENNFQEEQENNERRKKLYLLGPLMLLVALGGVSFAIFNYTRTGTANVIRVGKISFNSNQTETINLTNVFPIDSANVDTDTTNVDEALITITGDTTYPNGIEYLLTAVDVSNTVGTGNNQKTVPISIAVTATNGLGTADADYFTNRGSSSSVYKVLASDEIVDDGELVVGYIAAGQTGVSGSVTIKAYLDKDKIGISDTYDGTESDNMGTTNEWADGRTILTTTEWNALQTNGVSFKVKVEANEGVWVEEPTAADVIGAIQTLETTPYGKIYIGANPDNYVWFNNEQWRIIGVYGDNLKIVKATAELTLQKYYDNYSTDGNAWEGSHVQTILNGTYYNGLSSEAKNMIDNQATWNVGVVAAFNSTATSAYSSATTTTWTGKVGIIASYEYLYAAGTDCREIIGHSFSSCTSNDWLQNDNSWTLTPSTGGFGSGDVIVVQQNGINPAMNSSLNSAFPAVYLKPTVKITGGNGQAGETNSYKLG